MREGTDAYNKMKAEEDKLIAKLDVDVDDLLKEAE